MKKGLFVFALALVLAAGYPTARSFGEEKSHDCGHKQGSMKAGGCTGCQGHQGEHAAQHEGHQAASPQNGHEGHEGMHHGHAAGGEKLRWTGMAPHFVPMMKTMAGMSQTLADTMAQGMDDAKMEKLAAIMDAMSSQMVSLYDMMSNKGATEAEMHNLHMSMNDTEKQLKAIR